MTHLNPFEFEFEPFNMHLKIFEFEIFKFNSSPFDPFEFSFATGGFNRFITNRLVNLNYN